MCNSDETTSVQCILAQLSKAQERNYKKVQHWELLKKIYVHKLSTFNRIDYDEIHREKCTTTAPIYLVTPFLKYTINTVPSISHLGCRNISSRRRSTYSNELIDFVQIFVSPLIKS